MDFLKDFNVQPILLLAQVVNFLVLLVILKRFLYKPILKVLDERKQKIAQSLKNVQEIEERLVKLDEETKKQLKKTSEEAKKIIQEAAVTANQIIEQSHTRAGEDVKKIIAKAQAELKLERDKMQQEMRVELVNLVVLGLRKVAGKSLSANDQKDLVEKSMNSLTYEDR